MHTIRLILSWLVGFAFGVFLWVGVVVVGCLAIPFWAAWTLADEERRANKAEHWARVNGFTERQRELLIRVAYLGGEETP